MGGIYISDMEMPKSCAECDIKVRCFENAKNIEWLTYHPAFYEERLTDCPLVEAPKWIPVSERLPEESGEYIIFAVGRTWNQISSIEMHYWDGKRFYMPNFNYTATHWMPLPEPPEDK